MLEFIITNGFPFIFGCLIGYIIAAHNQKANKEQVSQLESRMAALYETLQARVDEIRSKH